MKLNKQQLTWSGKAIKIEGIKRVIKNTDPNNKKIGEIYEYESYMNAKKHGTNPIMIGRTVVNPKNPAKIKFIKIARN